MTARIFCTKIRSDFKDDGVLTFGFGVTDKHGRRVGSQVRLYTVEMIVRSDGLQSGYIVERWTGRPVEYLTSSSRKGRAVGVRIPGGPLGT